MKEDSRTFVIEATGVPMALDQLHNQLRKLAQEGERGGVEMTVKQATEKPTENIEFTNEHNKP